MIVSVAKPGTFECRQSPPFEIDADLGSITYAKCSGSACAHFRLIPLPCDDAWIAAVAKARTDIGDTSSASTKAAQHVNKHRAKYGLPTSPTHGYCGLAGKPEA